MKRKQFNRLRLILSTFCLLWILNFFVTVKIQLAKPLRDIIEYNQLSFNETNFWKGILNHEPKPTEEETTTEPTNTQSTHPLSNYSVTKQQYDTINDLQNNTANSRDSLIPKLDDMLSSFSKFWKDGGFSDQLIINGHQRKTKGYLTIGIPTVKRRFNDYFYLNTTLMSLIQSTDPNMMDRVTVLILMADYDSTWNAQTAEKLYNGFKTYFDSGFFQTITVPKNIYPNFSALQSTKRDSKERVMWRTKQNLDFAFMMLYANNLNQFYMQIEDDVLTAPGYIADIKSFVQMQTKRWFLLEFSYLGFIGKMFYSKDLFNIASYLLKNFKSQPCDLLLGSYRASLGQKKPIHYKFGLFQHIGKISSLKNKMMPVLDKKFKGFGSKVPKIMVLPHGIKPEAEFRTNMNFIPAFPPSNVYKNNSYFMANQARKKQTFQIVFKTHLDIKRLIISTGSLMRKENILEKGLLSVGAAEPEGSFCSILTALGEFVDGEIDTMIQGFKLPNRIDCVHIEVKKSQRKQLIIRDLQVFLD